MACAGGGEVRAGYAAMQAWEDEEAWDARLDTLEAAVAAWHDLELRRERAYPLAALQAHTASQS